MSDDGAKTEGASSVQRRLSLTWHRVRLLTATLLAFGPCAYLYASSRHGLGPGATAELLVVCWPFEIAAAFVAVLGMRRQKQAREAGALARPVARRYLMGSWLVFLLPLVVVIVTPFAFCFLFALSIGVAG
jgi:hypothetical protein